MAELVQSRSTRSKLWTRLLIGSALVIALGLIPTVRHAGSWLYLNFRSRGFTADRVHESQQRGDEIVHALESFRAAKGRCPDELDELVPQYLRAIQDPVAGFPAWRYCTLLTPGASLDQQTFELYFAYEPYSYPNSSYRPDRKSWHVDQ